MVTDQEVVMQVNTLARMVLVAGLVSSASVAAAQEKQQDIVETAVAAGQFNTLATALTQAGLVETLKGTGPYTVFAPTDEAFSAVPKATLDGLLADKAKLTKVLTYHVVPGKVMAADLVKQADKDGNITVKTVEGSELKIHVAGSKVHVGKEMANVTKADIVTSNGVIHVIDKVVLPPAGGMEKAAGY
jgi:uncharacterized surface protein with fasciclin (FAS1) repeats